MSRPEIITRAPFRAEAYDLEIPDGLKKRNLGKVSRSFLMQVLFPSHYLLPQLPYRLPNELPESELQSELRQKILQIFTLHPGNNVGLRTTIANEVWGQAPYILNFPPDQIDEKMDEIMAMIQENDILSILFNWLPENYGQNPNRHFVGKMRFSLPSSENVNVTPDSFRLRLEVVPDAISIREMDEELDARRIITLTNDLDQFSPQVSGFTAGLPDGVITDLRKLFFWELASRYDLEASLDALRSSGYCCIDFSGMHDGGNLRNLWLFDCE